MEIILKVVFLLSVFFIIYNHLIYPLLVIFLSRNIKTKKYVVSEEGMQFPKVSFIIAAYNEESVIQKKLENTLALDYPDDNLEIIVVSDGSNDQTPNIVDSFKDRGVVSLHDPVRAGKTSALNRAVSHASGDVLVFSDANNDFSRNAVTDLVKHFNDKNIGAVTGAKHIYENNSREAAAGDGLYWRYESIIKKAESSIGSITAADGEIVAVRSDLYEPINPRLINDDAAITFNIIKSGHRIIYEPEAKSFEQASENLFDDINVKIRMTAGGFQTLLHEKKYLFPPRNWFAFSFLSHKMLRWLTPQMMLLTLLSSVYLSNHNMFTVFLGAQLVFYSVSLYGWMTRKSHELKTWVYVPMYFTVMNIALFIGFIKFISGDYAVNWKKAKR